MLFMERLAEAQAELVAIYSLYNAASEKKLPDIDPNDNETLKKLLGVIQNREAIAYVQKVKKALPREVTELKRLLADVMLLLDGVDIKEIKARNKVVNTQT
jgi:DNA-directed RNA polymerase subunit F